jgi:MFS transporter, AAHS family, 4-hydroxybenzoate transporter
MQLRGQELARSADAVNIPAAVIDIDAIIDTRKVGAYQVAIGALGACALFVEGFDTSAIGYIAPAIAREWQVPSDTLGTILSADLLGLFPGYLFLAPLSARIGHKRMVVACTIAFGLLTFLTITATNVPMLIAFRFLTGVGVGGAMPSAVALTGEYFPERMRSTSITLVYIGYSIGQIGAGIVAGTLLAAYGWQSVLAFGGIVTLLFAGAFVFALPESLEFLVNRGNGEARARAILRRIAPDLSIAGNARLIAGAQGTRKVAMRQLLQEGRGLGTVLAWAGMFMNLMIYFFLQKWLTSLLVMVGLTQGQAIQATTLSLAGGIVAAFIVGPLMDRVGPYAVVSGLFAITTLAAIAMGAVLASPEPMAVLAASLAVGFCLSGGQKANNALAVYFYPTALRGTGLGWGLGIGRIGGVLGPIAAGALLTSGWTPGDLFYASALPLAAGAIAIFAMGQIYGHGAGASRLVQSHKT